MSDKTTKTEVKTAVPKITGKYFYGVGRRKTSTARAKFYENENNLTIMVNKKDLKTYFQDYYSKVITDAAGKVGLTSGILHFFIKGGGTMAQSEAARLAMVKALRIFDPEYGKSARTFGFITSDNRNIYPKQAGRRKSRKVEQWSKR